MVEARLTAALPRLLEEALKLKERIRSELASRLSEAERREAERDHHARRRPRPCGATVHVAIGCGFRCLYCYSPDMGFPPKPRPYPLTGEQLAYALAVNPYFVPGEGGSLVAFGSVTEPFQPETVERGLEYLAAVRRWLGNPTQVSTKAALRGEHLERLVREADPRIDVLISIATIRYARRLEPRAPDPRERLAFAAELIRRGRNATLFLRPIIPGVTDVEAPEILRLAKAAGIDVVVPGTMRVTVGIIERLRRAGFTEVVASIEKLLPWRPRSPREQVPLRAAHLKEKVSRLAKSMGFKVLPASCAANVLRHGVACYRCKWGPCGDSSKLPPVSEESVAEAVEVLGLKPVRVSITSPYSLVVTVRGSPPPWAEEVLSTVAKRDVKLRVAR